MANKDIPILDIQKKMENFKENMIELDLNYEDEFRMLTDSFMHYLNDLDVSNDYNISLDRAGYENTFTVEIDGIVLEEKWEL